MDCGSQGNPAMVLGPSEERGAARRGGAPRAIIQVKSLFRSVTGDMRSIFMMSCSSGSGQATRLSSVNQSFSWSSRCLAGNKGSTAASANMQKCLSGGITT